MTRFDLVVIGAGPAGMAAAVTAREAGLSVLLVDEQPEPGGQIWRAVERNKRDRPANFSFLGEDYAAGTVLAGRFRSCGAEYWPSAMVWHLDCPEKGDKSVVVARNGGTEQVAAGQVLIASGAMERPVPVPGWTLPGVMTIGAAQTVLKSSGLYPDAPLVLAGSGPLLLLFAAQCAAAHIPVSAILDTTPSGAPGRGLPHLPRAMLGWRTLLKGQKLLRAMKQSGVPVYRGVRDIAAIGEEAVERVRFTSGGESHELPAASLLLHEGVVPNPQLTRLIGCDHRWNTAQRCFHPVLDPWGESSVPGIFVAGDGGGIAGAEAAAAAGHLAGLAIAERTGTISEAERDLKATGPGDRLLAARAVRPMLDAMYPPPAWIATLDGDIPVCRCEEVSARAVRGAAADGAPGPNQAKAFLRAGMGPCQGRMCGLTVTEILADAHGREPGAIGYYRIRPPIKPVTVGELAALDGAD